MGNMVREALIEANIKKNTQYMISHMKNKCIVPATAQPFISLETSLCGEFPLLLCGYIYLFIYLLLCLK